MGQPTLLRFISWLYKAVWEFHWMIKVSLMWSSANEVLFGVFRPLRDEIMRFTSHVKVRALAMLAVRFGSIPSKSSSNPLSNLAIFWTSSKTTVFSMTALMCWNWRKEGYRNNSVSNKLSWSIGLFCTSIEPYNGWQYLKLMHWNIKIITTNKKSTPWRQNMQKYANKPKICKYMHLHNLDSPNYEIRSI